MNGFSSVRGKDIFQQNINRDIVWVLLDAWGGGIATHFLSYCRRYTAKKSRIAAILR
jgi:hypothetical protein